MKSTRYFNTVKASILNPSGSMEAKLKRQGSQKETKLSRLLSKAEWKRSPEAAGGWVRDMLGLYIPV